MPTIGPERLLECAEAVRIAYATERKHGRLRHKIAAGHEHLRPFADKQQHALMAGRDLRTPPGTAWAGSPEHQEQLRVERQRALERYRQEWGRDPV